MILRDTNVMSEVMRARADRAVIDGVDRQSMMDLFVCAVTKAEIEVVIGLLPDGERKRPLLVATEEVFAEFAQHCLPFDETAASAYARVIVERARSGSPISIEDAQMPRLAWHTASLSRPQYGRFPGNRRSEHR